MGGKTDGPVNIRTCRKERRIKSLLFRHFIYVNLGILVEPYKNLLFTSFWDKNAIFVQHSFVPRLTSACPARPLSKTANSSAP